MIHTGGRGGNSLEDRDRQERMRLLEMHEEFRQLLEVGASDDDDEEEEDGEKADDAVDANKDDEEEKEGDKKAVETTMTVNEDTTMQIDTTNQTSNIQDAIIKKGNRRF